MYICNIFFLNNRNENLNKHTLFVTVRTCMCVYVGGGGHSLPKGQQQENYIVKRTQFYPQTRKDLNSINVQYFQETNL